MHATCSSEILLSKQITVSNKGPLFTSRMLQFCPPRRRASVTGTLYLGEPVRAGPWLCLLFASLHNELLHSPVQHQRHPVVLLLLQEGLETKQRVQVEFRADRAEDEIRACIHSADLTPCTHLNTGSAQIRSDTETDRPNV
ncbi:hypothetical protein GOODEAATRI_003578 [Goodea atripinnis]|uniref:Uncharacterized protein n=1 Tax=Goodea atripinnis TaxID=208336 RepID=A0ABV0NH70_9TELE